MIWTKIERRGKTATNINAMKPLVSVVIPTHNHAHFVGEAIQSVLGQTYRDFEVIVVDDGSTDNTQQVVAEFGDQVRYIYQDNQGLSVARNSGIRAAKGELIGLLDADDLYEPDYMSTLVLFLSAHSKADAIYCACQFVDETNHPLPQWTGTVVPPEELHDTLLNGGFFPPLCMFAYKYCYERLGYFDKRFQGCADLDMWLRLSKQFTVIGSRKILARYRILPQSMSSNSARMLNDRIAVLQKHFGRGPLDIHNLSESQKRAYGNSYFTAAIENLQSHDLNGAYHYLSKALIIFPNLLLEGSIFYELAYGDQPKGFRGDFSTLDVRRNAHMLLDMLDQVFSDPQFATTLRDRRHLACANAYLAIGLLSYGAGEFAEARRFLRLAVFHDPKYVFDWKLQSTLVKSFVGRAGIDWLRLCKNKLCAFYSSLHTIHPS
jgi:glycosyltransferase involved in cell wall biosynthesis